MSNSKRISPAVLLALKEALTTIYWYKHDLKRFLCASLSNSPFIATLNWSEVKRDIAWEVVDRLSRDQENNQAVLLLLIQQVSEVNDFSHLLRLDDGTAKAQRAQLAVEALRKQIHGIDQLLVSHAEIENKRQQYHIEQQRLTGLHATLGELQREYMALLTSTNHQSRGFAFEKLLRKLFEVYDLDPKASFRVIGEQIDGAFTFENTDYLLEAKWQTVPVSIEALDALQAKVMRKLENTLGLFISINGFSEDAISAFTRNRPQLFLCDGADLMAVLEYRISLHDLLIRKRREASQTGNIYLPASSMLGV
jgi:hypothetical protein